MNVYLQREVMVGTKQEPLVLTRYLACYLWSSKIALWTEDVRKAWWGDLATAYKIQDQYGSSFLRALDKTTHLEKLLTAAKRNLDARKKIDMSTITNETEYTAAEGARQKAYQDYVHIVCTIDDVGAE